VLLRRYSSHISQMAHYWDLSGDVRVLEFVWRFLPCHPHIPTATACDREHPNTTIHPNCGRSFSGFKNFCRVIIIIIHLIWIPNRMHLLDNRKTSTNQHHQLRAKSSVEDIFSL